MPVGVSVGISVAPTDGVDAVTLLKNADLALYRAKAEGRNTYRFFEPEMDARMRARRELELDLRQALTTAAFELYYQPIVNVASSEVTSFEALLRWHHPDRGMIAPARVYSACGRNRIDHSNRRMGDPPGLRGCCDLAGQGSCRR